MAKSKSNDAITVLVRNWIVGERKKDRTWDAIGNDLGGVARATLVSIVNGHKGVGEKTKQAFATLKFGGSLDALRRAATGEIVATATGKPVIMDLSRFVLSDDAIGTIRYAMEVEKIMPEAVIEALSTNYMGDVGADLLDVLRIANRRIKRGYTVGEAVTDDNTREVLPSIESLKRR